MNRLVGVDGVLCTFATLMFYVLYLVVLDMGAEGYLLAIICGDAASSLFLFITGTLWRYIDFSRINRTLWREMLRFSLPMIPAQISFWIINASDMFFVNALCEGYGGRSGTEWSGLLSTGYFLPTILTTLGTIFYDAWQLSAVTEEHGRSRFYSNVFKSYASVMFCCAGGILWLCRPVMLIMKSSYFDAWQFVPYLTLAAVFSCFTQFMNSIYVVYKQSTHSLYTMMAGAVANCVMNYLGIVWFGPVGVTYASFLAMVLVFVLRVIDSRSMIRLRLHLPHMGVNVALLVAEAGITLAEVPWYGLWTGLLCAVVIAYNFDGVWTLGRAILPVCWAGAPRPWCAWWTRGAEGLPLKMLRDPAMRPLRRALFVCPPPTHFDAFFPLDKPRRTEKAPVSEGSKGGGGGEFMGPGSVCRRPRRSSAWPPGPHRRSPSGRRADRWWLRGS